MVYERIDDSDNYEELYQNHQINKITDLLQVTDSGDSDDNGI